MAPPTSADELASHLSPVQGAQGDAQLMVLRADDDPGTKTLAIVVMNHEGLDWYVKYTGTRKDWDEHRDECDYTKLLGTADSAAVNGDEE